MGSVCAVPPGGAGLGGRAAVGNRRQAWPCRFPAATHKVSALGSQPVSCTQMPGRPAPDPGSFLAGGRASALQLCG